MLSIDKETSIAVFSPSEKLTEEDFKQVAQLIDPFIIENGQLHGLIISVESFPGWQSFAALLSHLSFVKEHHKKINAVALVTNSSIGGLGEFLGSHFLAAEVKHFNYGNVDEAKAWVIARER